MDIVFLRHGRTELNQRGCFGGSLDIELCQKGREEIGAMKALLRNTAFDCVFCSPLKRTIVTAEILGVQYILDDRLREMNFGIFEGLSYSDICQRYPKESDDWQRDFVNYRLPQGESLLDVYNRTKSFVEDIKSKYHRVLAITHQGVIASALSMVFDRVDYYYKFRVDNGSLSTISIEDDYIFIKGVNAAGKMEVK